MSLYDKPIHAVIFDNDGVICDTLAIYFASIERIIKQKVQVIDVLTVNGMTDYACSQYFVEKYKLDMSVDDFYEEYQGYAQAHLSECEIVPGVERIIRAIKSTGIPMAVATSSLRKSHEIKTSRHNELLSLFDYVICGDEVTKAKPDPTIFQLASAKLGDFAPENVLVIEDAINGIRAANAAGMPSVLKDCVSPNPEEELEKRGVKATKAIHNFDEFDLGWFNFTPKQ